MIKEIKKCIYILPLKYTKGVEFGIVFKVFLRKLKSVRKWMLLFYNCYKTVSGHFFAICIFIFHKTEVQTVILRCLMGLNCNWFKSYGLRCSRRPRASSVNFWKVASNKWPFYDHIWPLFWKLHDYLWQNWDSDGHFEVLNKSKS